MVTIESGLGDVEYQFEFDKRQDPDIAKKFALAVRGDIALGETMEIKKVRGRNDDEQAIYNAMLFHDCLCKLYLLNYFVVFYTYTEAWTRNIF
jgi:hypothetical protein